MLKKMSAISFALVFFLNVTASGWSVDILDEKTYSGLMPFALVEHSGFNLPNDFALTLPQISNNGPVLPMFPVFKSQTFSKKFLGVQIPAKYLRKFNISTQAASNQIRNIVVPGNLRLVPFEYQGSIYGIREDVQVAYGSSSSVGLSISFNTGSETVFFGDIQTYGVSLNIGAPLTTMGTEKGLNLGKAFNNIFQNVDLAITGETAESLIEKTMFFTPYIQNAMMRNHQSLEKSKYQRYAWSAAKNEDVEIKMNSSDPRLPAPVPSNLWSKEFYQASTELQRPENLAKEVSWIEKLVPQVGATVILDNDQANRYIQGICNYLAQAMQVPQQIWPRCRILASWSPNAFAYPGGDIFISTGLLALLKDLDGVLLVLGHEIGHVVGRHTTHSMPYQNAVMYSANAIGIAGSIAATGFSLGGGAGVLGNVSWLSWFPQSMVAATGSGYVLDKGMQVAFFAPVAALMAYSRAHEWQADRFGHQAALAVGANQAGIYSSWEDFRKFTSRHSKPVQSILDKLNSSHPDSMSRQQEIAKRFSSIWEKMQGVNAQNRLSKEYYEEYKKLHEFLKPGLVNFEEDLLQAKSNSYSLAEDYMMKSLFSPSGQCITHALGVIHPD